VSRISSCFEQLKSRGRTALVPFVTAGDPAPSMTVSIMHALVEGGADIIELGVPFSDPMADGPVIQLASERALVHDTSLSDVIAMVAEFRKENDMIPVILMGYLNPLEAMGYEEFASSAAAAGVDGILMVDLPPEEALEVKPILDQQQIDLIFLIAPNTSDLRIETICKAASGYLYYVSLKGVTGSSLIDIDAVADKLVLIKQKTALPIAVGFGIKDPQTAARIASVSDAVIIGSVLVDQIAKLQDDPGLICEVTAGLVKAMRTEMDLGIEIKGSTVN
jgi:tryptophan synthase alpha chain